MFKKSRRLVHDFRKKIIGKLIVYVTINTFQCFGRGFLGVNRSFSRNDFWRGFLSFTILKSSERRITLCQQCVCDGNTTMQERKPLC